MLKSALRSSGCTIGLTGGIASGKSRVADILARLGATIVDADVISRELMRPGTEMMAQVVARWGPDVLAEDGSLDRKRLGVRVFKDAAATAELNRITHGAIIEEILQQVRSARTPVVVAVIPLLFETGANSHFDRNWLVACALPTQLERLHDRDGLNQDDAMARIERQWPLDRKLEKADVVLNNDGNLESLDEQVRQAWEALVAQIQGV